MKTILGIAATSGFLAVGLGAFGAHGLKAKLSPEMMTVYQTAVQYHFYHALALAVVGILLLQMPDSLWLKWSAGTFFTGLLLFSGSLYLLSLTEIRWLGAVTPIGGAGFLAGWFCLAVAAFKNS